jgi:hypothetical protein
MREGSTAATVQQNLAGVRLPLVGVLMVEDNMTHCMFDQHHGEVGAAAE